MVHPWFLFEMASLPSKWIQISYLPWLSLIQLLQRWFQYVTFYGIIPCLDLPAIQPISKSFFVLANLFLYHLIPLEVLLFDLHKRWIRPISFWSKLVLSLQFTEAFLEEYQPLNHPFRPEASCICYRLSCFFWLLIFPRPNMLFRFIYNL